MSSARSLSFLMPAKIIFVPLTNLRAVGRRAASPDATRGVAHWEVAAQRAARVFGPSSSRPAAGPRPVNAGCDNSLGRGAALLRDLEPLVQSSSHVMSAFLKAPL